MQYVYGGGGAGPASQFSHMQLERPLQVPSVIPVGPFILPPQHPLTRTLYEIRIDIAKLAVTEALQKAQNNPLRIYMWNQLSYNNFNNQDVTKLTKLIIDKVLFDTYQFGTNIDMTRLMDIIRTDVTIGCEMYAAINALERNPLLITPENQAHIGQLLQVVQATRNQIQQLYNQLEQNQQIGQMVAPVNQMGGMGGMSHMGGMGMFGAIQHPPVSLPNEAALTNVSGLALESQSIFSGTGIAAPSEVSNLHGNFGVLDDMDNYISDHLPLAIAPTPEPQEAVIYQVPSGGTATMISDKLSDIITVAKRFKPTADAQFCLTAFHPSYQKPAIFRLEDGSHQIANIEKGESEVDRAKHSAGVKMSGYQIPAAFFEEAFEEMQTKSDTEKPEAATEKKPVVPKSLNILIHDENRWEDSLDAAVNATRAELLVVPNRFAVKQHIVIGQAFFISEELKPILQAAVNTSDIREINKMIGEVLKATEPADDDSITVRGQKDATFHTINRLESDLTDAVNNALHYNLGIPAGQLRIGSVFSDFEDLMVALKEDFGDTFSDTLMAHQHEIVKLAISLMSDDGILNQSRLRLDFEGVLPNTVIQTGMAAIVTVTMATAEGLDLSTVDDLPAVIPNDASGIHTFIKSIATNENDLLARVYLATIDNHVFEIHIPWLVSPVMESYIIRKVS